MNTFIKIVSSFILFIGLATSTEAWQIELSDAYDVSGYWAYDITFSGEATDNLTIMGLSVGYDTDDVSFTSVDFKVYDDGSFPVANSTWVGGGLPYTDDPQNGLVYSIMGEEALDNPGSFYPMATGEKLLFTVYFEEEGGGSFDDSSVYFTYGSDITPLAVEAVEVNDVYIENHDLSISENTISAAAPVSISTIQDQTTNIGTTTDPIEIVIMPRQNGLATVTATSSNAGLISNTSIDLFLGDQVTHLSNPFNVTGGEQVTLYLIATPTDNETGTAGITITVSDPNNSSNAASDSFDLTVELVEASYDGPGVESQVHLNTSPVVLSGEKARGSQILLKIDSADAVEIVGAEADGDWTYDWSFAADGQYDFTLINQAGNVSDTFASGTIVYDTQPPVVPIVARRLTSVGYSNVLGDHPSDHSVSIRAMAPAGADSSQYTLCLDGQPYGPPIRAYAETKSGRNATDGENHSLVPIPVDRAGNVQADCSGNPVQWRFTADKDQANFFFLSLETPETGDEYVQIQWPPDATDAENWRVWAKSNSGDAYEEVSGTPEEDEYGNHIVFEDRTSPARLRSYKITDASGNEILVEFQRLDDPDSLVELTVAANQQTSRDTATDPIPLTLTPAVSVQLDITVSTSDDTLVLDGDITIWTDTQGTVLSNPLAVTAVTPVTLYLVVTPAAGQLGSTNVTVAAANHADPGQRSQTGFTLEVTLPEATLDQYGGGTTHVKESSVTLSGTKAQGYPLVIQVATELGMTPPEEIVASDVEGRWTYDLPLPEDGDYSFTLYQKVDGNHTTVATGTIVRDTQPPTQLITQRTLTGVSYEAGGGDTHTLTVRATPPAEADSSRFTLCVVGQAIGAGYDYGESCPLTATDGTDHTATPIPMDAAGNVPADCPGDPVQWRLESDPAQLADLHISLVEPDGTAAHVELKWSTASAAGDGVKVYGRTEIVDDYAELPGSVVEDAAGDWYLFEDTASPARIRSYRITDTEGNTLMEFQRQDDPVNPGDPTDPTDPSDPTDPEDGGGGGGAGGCFIGNIIQ